MLLAISQSVRSHLPQTPIGQVGAAQFSLVHSTARRSPMHSLALSMSSVTRANAAIMEPRHGLLFTRNPSSGYPLWFI
jgi:hypothetical protein